jgi:hypothetical protein
LAQTVAIGLLPVVLALQVQWTVAPYWMPWVLAALWLGAAALAILRADRATPLWPQRSGDWLSTGLLVFVGGFWGVLAVDAWRGRTPAAVPVVDLASPFAEGHYLVGNGGSRPAVNAHLAALDPPPADLQPYRGQAYAVDLVKLDRWGLRARGRQPRDPEAYHIFGEPVLAPCDGEIVDAVDGLPDLPVPESDRDNPAGNHVLLACSPDVVVVLAHLQEGSLAVEPGDEVATGTALAGIGNSGNTSEPHLHLHAQRPGPAGAPLAGDALQLTIGGRYLVRNDRLALPLSLPAADG